MKIVIAGANGILGVALTDHLNAHGHHLSILVRSKGHRLQKVEQWLWDGRTQGEWAAALENADVLIKLCGRSVDCRYTKKNRKRILDSRIDTTKALGVAISRMEKPPRVWINASSATIYRHAIDRPMTEANGEIGNDFSMNIVKAWEKEFYSNGKKGVRQLAIRTSIVMAQKGGAFVPLRRLTTVGMGGRQGNGEQMVSWIHIDDFCRAVDHLIEKEGIKGSINVTAPEPLTNRVFMRSLRKEIHMSLGFPQPKWILEIGAFLLRTETELLLKSRWVIPDRLIASGFIFHYPEWSRALSAILERKT